jgi:SAM-dependent methyltransferase
MTDVEPLVQLHLGCGRRQLPGFVHVDLADYPHIDHRTSIDDLPMFGDGSVDLIYSSHALEYFDPVEARAAIGEWARVLRLGGVLRLAVPDFQSLIEVYRRTGKLESILGPLFGRMEISGPSGPQVLYHRTTYDYASLERLCLEGGFSTVRRYDWRETIHKDFDDFSQAYYPHMDKTSGLLVSLNVEAVR